jgi:hypothetical protein
MNEVFKYKCSVTSLYQNTFFLGNLERLLDLPQVHERTQGTEYDSAFGKVLTSVGNEYSDITSLPGATKLVQWITDKLCETYSCKDIKYTKTWCNKMFKGSEGLVHAHYHPKLSQVVPDFVAIFYVNVPENGSELIFVEDGIFNSHYYDYDKSKLKFHKVKSGDLVIHSPYISHAVSIHNSQEPRICLVFEGNCIG